MAEYIDKQNVLNDMIQYLGIKSKDYLLPAERALYKRVEQAPAADVCPVVDVEEAVDETIRILDAINSSGRMDYEDYSKLHDVICAINPNFWDDTRRNDNGWVHQER